VSAAFEEWQREFLLSGRLTAAVATVRPDGSPHVKPVWFSLDEDVVVFTTHEATVAGRNLARERRVALSVDEFEPAGTFVVVRGMAELVTDQELVRFWAGRLGARYLGESRTDDPRLPWAATDESVGRPRRHSCRTGGDVAEERPGSTGQGGRQHRPGVTRGKVPQKIDRPRHRSAGGGSKGETVRQERTSAPGDRGGSANPTRSKVKRVHRRCIPAEDTRRRAARPMPAGRPLESAGNGRSRWMVAPRAKCREAARGQDPAYRPTRPSPEPLFCENGPGTPSDLR